MKIIEQRTRLIFTEYNDLEKRKIEDLVATDDKAFTYEDPDNHVIAFPPGMKDMVKHAFPKIPIDDQTKTYWEFNNINPVHHSMSPRNQLQIDCINFIIEWANKKEKVAAVVSPGTGKGHPVSTKIPTPTGWKRMGDLQVGDRIFGSDGNVITVDDIYDRGELDVYEVLFNDGRKAICDRDHLWNVYTYNQRHKQQTKSLSEIMTNYRVYTPYNVRTERDPYEYRYRIPLLSNPVQYDHQDIPIDPYVVGAFLGDGCCKEFALTISAANDFIPNKIAKKYGFNAKKSSSNNHSYVFYDYDRGYKERIRTSEFFAELPEMINSDSHNKRIPDIYKYNDLSIRLEVLRGLMDTDGCISYDGGRFNVRFSSCSKKLLEDVQELIRGLGFIANIGSPDKRVDRYKQGFHASLNIRVPQRFKQELFTVPYKLKEAKDAAKRSDYQQPFHHLIIKNIRHIGKEQVRCIRVSAPNELYLTEDFIVTHNTFMACFCAIKVGAKTLIITPTSGIKQQWAQTLTDMFKVNPSLVKLVNKPQEFINIKADFAVVSQASLAVLNKTYNLEKIMQTNRFGIKIIDEVQMWWHNMIKVDGNSNICHNWYLTGTFGRSGEDENRIYQEMYHDLHIFREKDKKPTLFNRKPGNIYGMKPHMHVKMVWMKSGLSKEEVQSCMGSMRYSERAGKWVRYGISMANYTELVIPQDGTMTRFLQTSLKIIENAEKEVKYGKTLILSATINSVEVIAGYVRKMFPDKKVYTYHSRNTKQENDEAKKECDILISTVSSCGTGFDLKGLAKLIVLQQFKSWILADQVSGRLRRRDDGKDTYMWDIVDSQIKQLRAWANSRADVLKRKSKSFKVIDM